MGCHACKCFVSEKVTNYSVDFYGLILCQDCQPQYENLKKSHGKLKESSTPEAQRLFGILIKKGFYAKLEFWDGYKHIDIALPGYKVNIEVDGKHHQNRKASPC